MTGFCERLRQFRLNWAADLEAAPTSIVELIGFRFNADDTPRFWEGDVATFWPPAIPAELTLDLPRFANIATHDDARRAA